MNEVSQGAVATKDLISINVGAISFPFEIFPAPLAPEWLIYKKAILTGGMYYSNIVLEKSFTTAPIFLTS